MEPHIAVFNCDAKFPSLAKYGDLGDLCCKLIDDTNISKFPTVKYDVFFDSGDEVKDSTDANKVYLELLEKFEQNAIKGLVLSGSRADSFDNSKPWINRLDEFLRTAVFSIPDFPIVGICFGHQIICKNLGCKVDRNLADIGWECGLSTITLNPEIFTIENGGFLELLRDENCGLINDHLNLPEIHRDIVYNLPNLQNSIGKSSKFISIGSSAKCSIQGIVTASGPVKVLTFQGHPEFSTEFVLDLLQDMHKRGTIDTHTFEKATYNSKILNNQGSLIAKLICQFINSLN